MARRVCRPRARARRSHERGRCPWRCMGLGRSRCPLFSPHTHATRTRAHTHTHMPAAAETLLAALEQAGGACTPHPRDAAAWLAVLAEVTWRGRGEREAGRAGAALDAALVRSPSLPLPPSHSITGPPPTWQTWSRPFPGGSYRGWVRLRRKRCACCFFSRRRRMRYAGARRACRGGAARHATPLLTSFSSSFSLSLSHSPG